MEAGIILIILVTIICVIAASIVIYNAVNRRKKPQGVLNVDYSDPIDGPYLFLELKVPIADVVSKKQVVFDVSMTNYVSQK